MDKNNAAQPVDLGVEELTIEELQEHTGASSTSTLATVSTPVDTLSSNGSF